MLTLQVKTSFSSNPEFYRSMSKGIGDGIKESAVSVRKEAQRLMSRKAHAERRRASGQATSGRSKAGEIPRSSSGNYRSSIQYKIFKGKRSAVVGPSQPKGAHAGMLKYGTKKMGARLVPSEVALERLQNRLVSSFANRI